MFASLVEVAAIVLKSELASNNAESVITLTPFWEGSSGWTPGYWMSNNQDASFVIGDVVINAQSNEQVSEYPVTVEEFYSAWPQDGSIGQAQGTVV
ncbi:MAG: hypothetical protein Q9218_005227, partial [Villophora microphyllina]